MAQTGRAIFKAENDMDTGDAGPATGGAASTSAPLTEAQLVSFLGQQAVAVWNADAKPYLLSMVTPDLKQQGLTYQGAIGDKTLAKWAETVEQDEFTVVRHPLHRANVGVIPFGEAYEFPRVAPRTPGLAIEFDDDRRTEGSGRQRKAVVVRFLETLTKLDPEDLDKIVLPVSVIVKLIKE
jgi:hypothetical protein